MSVADTISRLATAVTAIKNAISQKGVTVPSGSGLEDFPNLIGQISSGGITPTGNIQLTKATSTDVTNYATATVRNASVSLNNPSLNASTGVVTASANVATTGWIGSAPASKTLSLPTQAAQTITPTTTDQTITSGKYLTGNQTIKGDSKLVPGNIKKGVSIFNVAGSYEGSGGGGTIYYVDETTLTWQHNTYVTIGLDISSDGSLRAYKASGSGTANNMVVCYPQGSTFVEANVITAIDFPQEEGTYSMPISIWWDNQDGAHADHNNHTIEYTVLSQSGDIQIVPLSVTTNGTYSAPTGKAYSPVAVNVSGSSGMNVQAYHGMNSVNSTSYKASGSKLTVAKTGTYKVSWMAARNTTSGTNSTRLYINGSAYGTDQSTFTHSYVQAVTLNNVSLTAGQTVEVYARSRGSTYYMDVGNLIIEQTA